MAEFSKQWCEMNDIVKIFNNLDEGYCQSVICEDLGILGVAKENGKLMIARRNEITDEVTWELGDFLLHS